MAQAKIQQRILYHFPYWLLGLADDDHIIGNIMTSGYWELCIIFIYLYYVYLMTYILSYDDFWVSLCMHPRHHDDWLETAKNVLAVRLV